MKWPWTHEGEVPNETVDRLEEVAERLESVTVELRTKVTKMRSEEHPEHG